MVVALGAAVLLAGALLWASFTASSEAIGPRALATSPASDRSYQLTGKVVASARGPIASLDAVKLAHSSAPASSTAAPRATTIRVRRWLGLLILRSPLHSQGVVP